MPLNVRTYECSECGQVIDRDVNAAINIRDFAVFRVIRKDLLSTDGTSGINACGDGSSGNYDESCNCETTVSEARKFLRKKLRNGNHL